MDEDLIKSFEKLRMTVIRRGLAAPSLTVNEICSIMGIKLTDLSDMFGLIMTTIRLTEEEMRDN